ncbi:MAG: sunset domain-containing protein [Acidimicrobiales bacterium]|jgi:hypothetical protein
MSFVISRILRFSGFAAIGTIAVGIVRAVRPAPKPDVTGVASWEPMVSKATPTRTSGPVQFTTIDLWVEPVDGACPVSHPIKGNDGSKIFHVPGGSSYDRTAPERCYASAEDAEADGYRQAKR